MRIRFYGGEICTMENPDRPEMIGGELWTLDDAVDYVGPPRQDPPPFDQEIDVKGGLILPGFKNAHTHSGMTFLRSLADDLPVGQWLEEQVFPMEARLDGEMVYHLCKLAIMEYLTSGITANFDMYLFEEHQAKASVDCGFRTVLCGNVNNFVSSVERTEQSFLRYNSLHPLISYRLGFHAEYTCGRPILEGIAALSEKYRAPVWCHSSENYSEVEDCLVRTGMTPTAYLDSIGLFHYGGGCFHCVHVYDRDMEILHDRQLWVVTNPASNCKLASGIAPLAQMAKRDISIAIGTDGPASNNCLDFFREMFLCTALQKVREQDAAAMSALKVLRMATVDGARAMGLKDCDCLAPGKCADLVVIDLNQPNMQPKNDTLRNIVYSGSKQNVRLTMVGGRILYENGRFHIGVEPEEVYAKANEIAAALRSGGSAG